MLFQTPDISLLSGPPFYTLLLVVTYLLPRVFGDIGILSCLVYSGFISIVLGVNDPLIQIM